MTERSVRKWSQEAEETLQGCFETTNWIGLCQEHGEDINAMAECVTDYINSCVDSIITTRAGKCFPNNKPWITSDRRD